MKERKWLKPKGGRKKKQHKVQGGGGKENANDNKECQTSKTSKEYKCLSFYEKAQCLKGYICELFVKSHKWNY